MRNILGKLNLLCLLGMLLLAGQAWPATLLVRDPGDSGINTLRWAVTNANSNTGNVDTIAIALAPNVPIQLASQIDITGPVIINGNGVTITAVTDFTYPLLVLTSDSGGSLVRDLCLTRGSNGLRIESSGNTVWGCSMGMLWNTGLDPNVHGLFILGDQNQIGGPSVFMRNYFSGNSQNGIYGWSASRVVIQNNFIGTNIAGATARSNLRSGIYLQDCTYCLVGGDRGANQDNLISGNIDDGVSLIGGFGNSICGNIIGLRGNQSTAISNTSCGIYINNSSGNFIGLPQTGFGNIIGGNGRAGIELAVGATNRNVVIRNNLIGLNESNTAMPNVSGIRVGNTQDCIIGGFRNDAYLHRNAISGNSGSGIWVSGNNQNTVITGNHIGTSADGTAALGNDIGINLSNPARMIVGGATSLVGGDMLGNVISGNNTFGVYLGTSASNTIVGNYIGLNFDGSAAVPNGTNGISLANSSPMNIIGGLRQATQTLGNVISGNTQHGVYIQNNNYNYVAGNLIGLNAAGTAALANGQRGIELFGSGNQVGGASFQERNYISGNGSEGMAVISSPLGNLIQYNYFGLDVNGMKIANGSGTDLFLSFAPLNMILGNYTSGYITLTGSGTWGNTLTANSIGSRPDQIGTSPIYGVLIAAGAHGNFIGQYPTGLGNLIYSATTTGIVINGAATLNNAVWGNTLYACATPMALVAGGNANKTPPLILTAVAQTLVSGTSAAGDRIEVVRAENLQTNGGSVIVLANTTADASGNWSVNPGAQALQGYYVSALATDSSNNTSGYAANVTLAPAPTRTRTPTPSRTPTPTITRTITNTCTFTLTSTFSPTSSPTPSITGTPTISVTSTPSASHTPTGTITPTATVTPSSTDSPTISPTATITPTHTGTRTITATPTVSPTATITLSSTCTPTITLTRTPSTTRTITLTSTTTSENPQSGIDLGGKKALAYPNPGKEKMAFSVKVDTAAGIRIVIYNLAGERIADLKANCPAGIGQIVWNCANQAPGIYLARVLQESKEIACLKVVVVR